MKKKNYDDDVDGNIEMEVVVIKIIYIHELVNFILW